MNSITLKSYGKINIFLHILGKRPDGFHELFTLFSKIGLHDTLIIEKSDQQTIICDRAGIPTDEKNIINKVHKILREEHGIEQNFKCEIIKRIPDGGGLGGGSSNGAVYLSGVCELLGIDMPMQTRTDIMSAVGSDTAFFLHDQPMIGEGRGELLRPYGKLPDCALLLVNPRIQVPTGRIFTSGNYKLTQGTEVNRMRHISDYDEYETILFNGLEQAVFAMYPVVRECRDALADAGADYAMMSGSGATVFGIYKDEDKARKGKEYINEKHPDWDAFITELI